MIVYRRLFSFVAAGGALVVLLGASAGNALAAGDATCAGGSIASGVYSSLKIAGTCTVDSGSVTVKGNLTVLPGGTLIAATGGIDGFGGPSLSSDLTVAGNLDVQEGGVMTLGCEPVFYTCFNDPQFVTGPGTYLTQHTVAGNLTAENALGVVIHHTTVLGNVKLKGGGGGANCNSFLPALGAPPYGDFEDMTVGGNLTIIGWQSCWLGVFRTRVAHNFDFDGNVTVALGFTGQPDGNEMQNNTVFGNLSCSENNPSPQVGDSGGGPSTVLGIVSGQCNSPLLVRPQS